MRGPYLIEAALARRRATGDLIERALDEARARQFRLSARF